MADNEELDNLVKIESPEQLEEVVEENETVLVDFMAEWCGPCQMMESTIEEIAEDNDVVVAEVDVDSNQKVAANHSVRSVPTYIFYKDGQKTEQMVGYQEKEDMEENL